MNTKIIAMYLPQYHTTINGGERDIQIGLRSKSPNLFLKIIISLGCRSTKIITILQM